VLSLPENGFSNQGEAIFFGPTSSDKAQPIGHETSGLKDCESSFVTLMSTSATKTSSGIWPYFNQIQIENVIATKPYKFAPPPEPLFLMPETQNQDTSQCIIGGQSYFFPPQPNSDLLEPFMIFKATKGIPLTPRSSASYTSHVVLNPQGINTGYSSFRAFGDTFQFANPIMAHAETILRGDDEGRHQFYKHALFCTIMTQGLKEGFNHTSLGVRPNGGRGNTPSGHSAAALTAASFMRERYGIGEAIPYYALALLVGASRVDAGVHDPHSVLVALLLTELSAEKFVDPQGDMGADHTSYSVPDQLWAPLVISDNENTYFGVQWSLSF
jgi:membrane-associated phospholipid phosphatase